MGLLLYSCGLYRNIVHILQSAEPCIEILQIVTLEAWVKVLTCETGRAEMGRISFCDT